MPEHLKIVHYPDPVLRVRCRPVGVEALSEPDKVEELAALVRRMGELLLERGGVGLAAPQVGLATRLFVVNLSGEAGREKAYINPQLDGLTGQAETEEGCLSIPEVNVPVRRAAEVTIRALGLDGRRFEEKAEGLAARVWQHETDHLNGRLILDYMSAESKLVNRRALQELQSAWERAHPEAEKASRSRKGRRSGSRRAARR